MTAEAIICLFFAAGGLDCRTHFEPGCPLYAAVGAPTTPVNRRVSDDQGDRVAAAHKKTARTGGGDHRSFGPYRLLESGSKRRNAPPRYGIRPFRRGAGSQRMASGPGRPRDVLRVRAVRSERVPRREPVFHRLSLFRDTGHRFRTTPPSAPQFTFTPKWSASCAPVKPPVKLCGSRAASSHHICSTTSRSKTAAMALLQVCPLRCGSTGSSSMP